MHSNNLIASSIVAYGDLALAALRISESRYRRLFETAQDGILLLNADTAQIEDANPYLIKMLGYTHEEFLGKKLWEVGPFADIAQSKEMFSELQTEGYVRYDDLPLKTKAGLQIQVEFVSNSYNCEGIKVIQCNIRDATERKVAEAEIQRHIHLYAALSQCNKAIVHCTSEEDLFPQVCRAAVQYGDMKLAWVGLIDADTLKVRPVACFGEGADDLGDIEVSVDVKSPYGHGPAGTSIRENRPFWCQDFLNDPATIPWHERGTRSGWVASASLPLHRQGKVIGAFVLYSDKTNPFDQPARNLLEEMAGDISFALDSFDRALLHRRLESEIQFQNTMLRTQLETMLDAMLIVDEHENILSYNQKFIELWGIPSESMSTVKDESVLQSVLEKVENPDEFLARVQYLIAHRKEKSRDELLLNDGRILDRYSAPVAEADGNYFGRVWYFRDITERKRAEKEIERLAFYDPLTSLPNRRLLHDRLQHSLAACSRHHNHGAVLFIDLDNFKSLNDTKGHNIGDLLLIEVANRLQACIRGNDTVARVGGDEFVVILEELCEDSLQAGAQVEAIADKILAAVSEVYSLQGYEYYGSASIGISLFYNQESTMEELLKRADSAMYQAKIAGRKIMRFYDPAMQVALEARTALESDLRHAITENLFNLYYQMQVDHSGKIIGAEALIRWQHPQLGMVSPVQFIPLAEEIGLILPIGQWVLETACAQLDLWKTDPLTHKLQLAVNVSASQFHQPDFVEQVRKILQGHAFNPDRLKLELTESIMLDSIDDTIDKMQALRQDGVRFSMDDFGTGYSSLAYLTQLPFNQLKIDQSFVRNIGVKQSDAVIVQTIIGMANNLGMEVIAEGVETDEQRQFLESTGCHRFQGYLFGKPCPIHEFETQLKLSSLFRE